MRSANASKNGSKQTQTQKEEKWIPRAIICAINSGKQRKITPNAKKIK